MTVSLKNSMCYEEASKKYSHGLTDENLSIDLSTSPYPNPVMRRLVLLCNDLLIEVLDELSCSCSFYH